MKAENLRDLHWPLALIVHIRETLILLFVLGVAIACLVVGSTDGRYVGAVLLVAWVLVAYRIVRRT